MILEEISENAPFAAVAPKRTFRAAVGDLARGISSAVEWLFGVVSLVLGLAILAALPIAQFLSMGYFLECSARVARSGRLRDGVIGARRAARVGGICAGVWLASLPLWLFSSFAQSAELIEPGGRIAQGWRLWVIVWSILTFLHIVMACIRGGRLRYFLWPFGHPFFLVRKLRQGGLYTDARDGLWTFVALLYLPHYFRLGLIGFLGTLLWLALPALMISAGGRYPILFLIGGIWLAIIVPFLPFLQVRYAVEGRVASFYSSRREVRDRFRRAPWAFAFALLITLLAAVPLYLLKIEMVPREAAWLPSLVFVIFLAPARLLVGWAYARSERREAPRHWLFRTLGRLAIIPTALFYVIAVFIAQYTSWAGVWTVYEQHAFLLPVPFLNM